jgi:hypothetical protein
MVYTTKILLCPLVVMLSLPKCASSVALMKQRNAQHFIEKHQPNFPHAGKSAITHKLNVSGHMDIFSCFGM